MGVWTGTKLHTLLHAVTYLFYLFPQIEDLEDISSQAISFIVLCLVSEFSVLHCDQICLPMFVQNRSMALTTNMLFSYVAYLALVYPLLGLLSRVLLLPCLNVYNGGCSN